jgi:hypothetical protein
VPALFYKAQWATLPGILKINRRFDCQADCQSACMAYAESKRMRLQCVTTDEHYVRFACFGCEDFKLRFAVEEHGDTIGIDGEPTTGREWRVTVACLTHAPACDYLSIARNAKSRSRHPRPSSRSHC